MHPTPDQSDAEWQRLKRYESNAIQSMAPDQSAAESARLGRYEGAARDQEWIEQDDSIMARRADEMPLPRAEDGGVVLPNGRVVHPSVTVGPLTPVESVDAATSTGNQRRPLYIGEKGPVYAGDGGQPFYGLARDTSYAVPGVPKWAQPADGSGLAYTFDSTGQPFWRTHNGTPMSIPAPYALPQLSDLQGSALWCGIKDGVTGLPGTLANGVSDLAHGRFTVDSLLTGLYENSPVGVLGAMADDNYRAAGGRLVGTGVGLATGAAFEYGVMPAGRAAWGKAMGALDLSIENALPSTWYFGPESAPTGAFRLGETVSVFRKMSTLEAATTLETMQLQPPIPGTNSSKYLSESMDKVWRFQNEQAASVEQATVEFKLGKVGYDELMSTAVKQSGSQGLPEVKYNLEGIREPGLRNIGVPRSRLSDFNSLIYDISLVPAPR